MSLWFAVARAPDTDESLCAQLRAALTVVAAVEDRLVRAGIAGMDGAVDTQRKIDGVLGGIDATRLAALRQTVGMLEHELCRAAQVLARIRALKEALDAPSGSIPK